MARRFSLLISWACGAALVGVPLAATYCLVRIDDFAEFAQSTLALPIRWQTVTLWQWYSLWLVTALYLAIGLAGLYFLRKAFANFAKGEMFNFENSNNLRMFSLFLFAQGIFKPLHFAISSVLLSANHAAGQKMLSLSLGGTEIKIIGVAMAFWVVSSLLVEGCELQAENRQFV